MASFVLVHGAWHAGWCWEAVASRLGARGHRVATPDLPGHGEDRTPIAEVTLARYVAHLSDLLEKQSEPAILVGHSLGGLSVSGAASRQPGRIQALVYLAAFVPETMQPLETLQPRLALAGAMQLDVERGTAELDHNQVAALFYGDCTASQQAWAMERLQSQALEPMLASPERSSEHRKVRQIYVECLRDRVVPIDVQREMHEPLACTVHRLDTSHSPFLSSPDLVADLLELIAES